MAPGEGDLAAEALAPREEGSDGALRTAPGPLEFRGSILGHAVRRSEDPRFLDGSARYTDDLPVEGALHAVFVRSTFAHAVISSIDGAEASGMPGVVAVITEADLGLAPLGGGMAGPAFSRPLLAKGRVRFVGEAVAVVVAESRAQAMDAAEAVVVDYQPEPAVVDPLAALEDGAPLLFPEHGSNLAVEHGFDPDPAWDQGADVVVKGRIVNQRLAPVPLEPNGLLAVPGEEGGDADVTVWIPTQAPHWARDEIAEALSLEKKRVRVIAPAVGGGFGAKATTYPEQIVVADLARRLGRPVRYTETRSENMMAMNHGRAQIQDLEVAATRDGTLTGMRVRLIADTGAYTSDAVFLPRLTQMMAPGVYRLPHVDYGVKCVVTNTTPIGAYRGAGRPEAAALIERAMDMVAAELGVDPAEVRRRNLIPAFDRGHRTTVGTEYDVGDFGLAMDEALRLAGYQDLRREQAERRARGDRAQMGIGLAVYVEVTGFGSDFGSAEVHADGTATVMTGISPHGQGHETSLAQVAASVLGIPFERISVVHSDTFAVPRGNGTMGSRSLQVGGSAVYRASEAVLEKGKKVAGHLLETAPDDVVLTDDGRLGIAGAPDRSLGWPEVAAAAADPDRLPQGLEPGLAESLDFDAGGTSFPFGAHVAVAEVDVETGDARLIRIVAVDDCGRIVNPMLVEGQVHGGLAQGIAQALYEGVTYDEDGNPLTANLMGYGMPSAADLPSFETAHTVTPTYLNPLGAKGIGESAT
ncbi:MAG TPA: xanthine dehydrogenase family protein molybdopterin-binding subunit, partial [Actinomycetota bacterium]|nr:xanthine dehydrogenase family protein molybdopterin-binding subunit [Actinomycetota bacterium]